LPVQVRFSRDGRFFSFHSNASGRWDVYVAPFPPTGETIRISPAGGFEARWSRDGKELFFESADGRLMAVQMQTSPTLHVGTATSLFEMDPKRMWSEFDVTPGGRFLGRFRDAGLPAAADRGPELDGGNRALTSSFPSLVA
jgi:hypothetical protein